MAGRDPARRAWTAHALAAEVLRRSNGQVSGEINGDEFVAIIATGTLEGAGQGQIAFLANRRYQSAALQSRAELIVIHHDDAEVLFPNGRPHGTWISTATPYAWFAFAAQILVNRPEDKSGGVHPTASVDASASIASSAHIDATAVIGADVHIGAGARVGAGVVIGDNCHIGERTVLHPRVVFYEGCSIGTDGIVHAGAVVGADGFGFAPLNGTWIKIPQTGRAVLGDHVEIGANTTVDRGAIGDTVIEDGVKIDNQVQIGHNCRIGAHAAIAGCVGIAGSANIGRRCQIGGAAMIGGHLTVVDDVIISAGSLVSRDIRQVGFYTGVFPLMTNDDWERNAAVLRRLADLRTRVRALQKRDARNANDSNAE